MSVHVCVKSGNEGPQGFVWILADPFPRFALRPFSEDALDVTVDSQFLLLPRVEKLHPVCEPQFFHL